MNLLLLPPSLAPNGLSYFTMAHPIHSYGPSCALHEDFNRFTRKASEISDEPPRIRPHFFYSSTLPIDDPLSPLPSPSTSFSSGISKVPPRPFSTYDNAALEEAWQGLTKAEEKGAAYGRKIHGHGLWCHDFDLKNKKVDSESPACTGVEDDGGKTHHYGSVCTSDKLEGKKRQKYVSKSPERASPNTKAMAESPPDQERGSSVENLAKIVRDATASGSAHGNLDSKGKDREKVLEKSKLSTMTPMPDSASSIALGTNENTVSCGNTEHDAQSITPQAASILIATTKSQHKNDSHVLLCDDPQYVPIDDSVPIDSDEIAEKEFEAGVPERRHRSIFHLKSSYNKEKVSKSKTSPKTSRRSSRHKPMPVTASYGSSPSERHTTGNPFLRAPSPGRHKATAQNDGADTASEDEGASTASTRPIFRRYHSDNSARSGSEDAGRSHSASHEKKKAYVPVGLSRLHLVEMPLLLVSFPALWIPSQTNPIR